jgi:hypothetical protein
MGIRPGLEIDLGATWAQIARHCGILRHVPREIDLSSSDTIRLKAALTRGSQRAERSLPITSEERRCWRNYNRYLNSRDWQRARQTAPKRDGRRCVDFGIRGNRHNPLQVDHLSYAEIDRNRPYADYRPRKRVLKMSSNPRRTAI